jgi:hypothetical protein
MRLTLIQLSAFAAKWSKLGLTDEDLQAWREYCSPIRRQDK